MYKARINDEDELNIQFNTEDFSSGLLNGKPFQWDCVSVQKNSDAFHIIYNNQSYNASLLDYDTEQKKMVISIRGNYYTVIITDELDELLKKLGVGLKKSNHAKELKAPMPGLVKEIKINVGDEVAEGQSLLILEAMKMENIIKSPVKAIIKSIEIEKYMAVEKNQVLIRFQ